MSRKRNFPYLIVALLPMAIAPLTLAAVTPVDAAPSAEVHRPQTPRAPFPYAVEDVSFAGAEPM